VPGRTTERRRSNHYTASNKTRHLQATLYETMQTGGELLKRAPLARCMASVEAARQRIGPATFGVDFATRLGGTSSGTRMP
jgi:hypothetical protein